MKQKLICIIIVLFSLFMCSCSDEPKKPTTQNKFGLTEKEVQKGVEVYEDLENKMKNFSTLMEQKNSIQWNMNTYYYLDSSVVNTQHITMKAKQSPVSILIESVGTPIFLLQEEKTDIYRYTFDLDRNGYYKKKISKDSIDSILEDSGIDDDTIFELKVDPTKAKISYDEKYSIEVYIEDLIELNDNFSIDDISESLNASKDRLLKSILKYEVSVKEDKLDVKLSLEFKQWVAGKEIKASIVIQYSFIINDQFSEIDLSNYHELPANSPEDISEYTSIEDTFSSLYKAQNDTYKIRLTPGTYTIPHSSDMSLTFLDEHMEKFPSYPIEYSTVDVLIIEEEMDLYMQVTQFLEEGYTLTFSKQTDTVKKIQPLPDKIEVTFEHPYDYVIYDTSSYTQEYMVLKNNTDKDICIAAPNFASQVEKNEFSSFWFQYPYLIIFNPEQSRFVMDMNIYTPKNYGKVDITDGTEEYYLIGAQGFEADFTFKVKQTGYFQIELVDANNNTIHPNCNWNGFSDTFHGFEESTYHLKLSEIVLDKPGLYKIRIKMIE